jgi:hypothetical protein
VKPEDLSMKPACLRLSQCFLASLVFGGAAWATSLPFDFVHHGHFQRMMHMGDTAGRVAMSALSQRPGTWGVGATEGLEGEIV